MKFRLESECLQLNRLIGQLNAKAHSGGQHRDTDYKLLKKKQWQARGRIFLLQGGLCTRMPGGCEPELIDMRYPCEAVAAPGPALLTEQDNWSRACERNVKEVAEFNVSEQI